MPSESMYVYPGLGGAVEVRAGRKLPPCGTPSNTVAGVALPAVGRLSQTALLSQNSKLMFISVFTYLSVYYLHHFGHGGYTRKVFPYKTNLFRYAAEQSCHESRLSSVYLSQNELKQLG